MSMYSQPRLVSLMSEYYETIDKIASLRANAAALKAQILDHCNPGRYGRYQVYHVKKTRILVREHFRRAYTGIRRNRQ